MSTLSELSEAVAGAARHVGPAVVGLGRGWGLGSGVVIGEGHVLTSAHNLRREEVAVSFADGRREPGEPAGADADLDLAVIAVDTGDAEPVAWEPAEQGRSFRGPRGRRINAAIEHTAPLPRGSSGGPLVDAAGRLLGINSLRMEGGLILAVPATAAVRERAALLSRGEAVSPHRLGVAVAPPRVARRMRRAVGLSERSG